MNPILSFMTFHLEIYSPFWWCRLLSITFSSFQTSFTECAADISLSLSTQSRGVRLGKYAVKLESCLGSPCVGPVSGSMSTHASSVPLPVITNTFEHCVGTSIQPYRRVQCLDQASLLLCNPLCLGWLSQPDLVQGEHLEALSLLIGPCI